MWHYFKKGKFDQWLDLMKSSIYNYSYYIDFDKVDRNIEEIYTKIGYKVIKTVANKSIRNRWIKESLKR